MGTLTISGKKVRVDDSFANLTPEQQEATVNEIAAHMGEAGAAGTASVEAPSGAQQQLNDVIRQQLHMGQAGQSPDLTGNPQASVLPGMVGDAANTLNAATAGAQQGLMMNWGDELGAAMMTPIEMAMAGNLDVPGAYKRAYDKGTQLTAQQQQLNPDAFGFGKAAGSLGLMGRARAAPGVAPSPAMSPGRMAAQAGGYGVVSGLGEGETLQDRLINAGTGGLASAALGFSLGKVLGPGKTAVPTVKSLMDDAKAGFQAAEATGAIIPQPAVKGFTSDVRKILDDEGLITPSGKVADLPKVSHALTLADEFAAGTLTMKQAKTLRKSLRRAAGSIDPEERRIGVMLLEKFDDFIEREAGAAAPMWAAARENYHVAKKGQSVEKLLETAKRKSHKFSGSGRENAIRTQFDNFVGKDSNLRGFSPLERAALNHVATGTPVGNVARSVGKLAPTGVVSAGLSGGVPFMIGNAMGGPALGALMSGGSMGLGIVGRAVATLSTKGQAELARAIVLNGGKLPSKVPLNLSPEVKRALGNLILIAGANSPEVGAAILKLLSGGNSQPGTPAVAQPAL